MPETAQLLAANEALARAVGDLSVKVGRLRSSTRNVIVLSVVLALLVIGVIVNAVRADRADSKASRIQEYQVSNCISANDTRAEAKGLWDGVIQLLDVPTNKKRAASQKQFVTALRAKVTKAYAPHDCGKVAK